jgi:hypothetical protein
MLAAVNGLRLAAAGGILGVVAALGFSCSWKGVPDCGIPSPSETTADGGPDPCHCDPPPSLNLQACPCLSGTQDDADVYNACMTIYRAEMMDAGGG